MRRQLQGCRRSVDRGTCRLGIELRNNRDRSADVVPHGGRQHRRMCYRKHPQDSAQSETPGMYGNSTRENRETPSTPVVEGVTGRLEKAVSQKSNTHVGGESDGRVVLTKCPNNGDRRRAWREGDRPRRTSGRRPRPGRRAGPARRATCTVCVKQQVGTSGRGSPRCSTTSRPSC